MTTTVKIRVAVAVDAEGHWNACGAEGMSDSEAMGCAIEGVKDGEARYYVTAEVGIPEYPVIAGNAEPA